MVLSYKGVPNYLVGSIREQGEHFLQGTMSKVIFQMWLETSVPKDTLQMSAGREEEAPLTKGSPPFIAKFRPFWSWWTTTLAAGFPNRHPLYWPTPLHAPDFLSKKNYPRNMA